MATSTLHLTELGCASCVMDIEGALEAIPGVRRAEVHAARGDVTVEHSAEVTVAVLVQALAAAGHAVSLTKE